MIKKLLFFIVAGILATNSYATELKSRVYGYVEGYVEQVEESPTWYVRYGYTFESSFGEITPYVQWDYYKNPEMIASKDLGGDNEAGISDDGAFIKQTIGIVARPDSQFAIKVDASNHQQEMDGKDENYAEVRSSFSYIWSL